MSTAPAPRRPEPDPDRDPDSSTDRDPGTGFVAEHQSLDDRLEAAFRRYDKAFHSSEVPSAELVQARLDLSLLLWSEEEAPQEVQQQLASDGQQLLRETPPI